MDKKEEYQILLNDFLDIQQTVRAQDTKIGILFVAILLPFNQVQYLSYLKSLHNQEAGWILFVIVVLAWIISFLSLIYGIYPRWDKKKSEFNPMLIVEPTQQHIDNLKYNRDVVEKICTNKIKSIRLCLFSMIVWNVLGIALAYVVIK